MALRMTGLITVSYFSFPFVNHLVTIRKIHVVHPGLRIESSGLGLVREDVLERGQAGVGLEMLAKPDRAVVSDLVCFQPAKRRKIHDIKNTRKIKPQMYRKRLKKVFLFAFWHLFATLLAPGLPCGSHVGPGT